MADVFISHATENKDIAEALTTALENEGVSVWLDKTKLRLGSPLRRGIEEGLRNSRFLVVVFSPEYFRKVWTQAELDAIASRDRDEPGAFLPVLHNVTVAEFKDHVPTLGDRHAAFTSEGVDEVAKLILEVVRGQHEDVAGSLAERAAEFLEKGRYGEAIREAEECLRHDPGHPDGLVCRSRARFWQGLYQEAENDAIQALARAPTHATALLMRAQARWMLGHIEESLNDCAAILRLKPRTSLEFMARAFAEGALGDIAAALEAAETALRLDPGNPSAMVARAFALVAKGKAEEAFVDVNAALAINPRNPSALSARSQAEMMRGEMKQALNDATEALNLQPGNPMALALRAEIYQALGRPQEAVRDASDALAIDPRNLFALTARASSLFQMQDARWFQDAQAIVAQPPRTPFDRILRARALVACNRPQDALVETNAALQADPSNQMALAFRGSIHMASQRFDDALRDANAALGVNPRNPFALMIRAQTSLMTGNSEQAARDAIELLRIRPDDQMAGSLLDMARNPWKLNMMKMGMAARNWMQPPPGPAGAPPGQFPPPYKG